MNARRTCKQARNSRASLCVEKGYIIKSAALHNALGAFRIVFSAFWTKNNKQEESAILSTNVGETSTKSKTF